MVVVAPLRFYEKNRYMKHSTFFTSLMTILFGVTTSCTQKEVVTSQPQDTSSTEVRGALQDQVPMEAIRTGVMYVKIPRETVLPKIEKRHGGLEMSALPGPLAQTMSSVSATRLERVFTPGKYEQRLRSMDMDTWYYMYYDEESQPDVKVVMNTLVNSGLLDRVEYVERIERPSFEITPVADTDIQMLMQQQRTAKDLPFNDPLLSRQWHYSNDGSIHDSAVAGADINLFNAWKDETGKPNVIVAIIDGGIDYEHEDLVDNMWVNVKERDGVAGEDSDGNGYIDDVHGVNLVYFADKTQEDYGRVVPDDGSHGTHVAGTVAARNGNDIGVCGVAGGDGTPESGVRLMSVQIFRKGREQGDAPKAFQYACDMGAVIAQNSWGYPAGSNYFPTPLRKAIDYFIKYAGCDENGNQRPDSPMKGGVVLFAAGNDNADNICYPAMYDKVISVSSFGFSWLRASYTNRGGWVTLCAPGGDINRFRTKTSGILSTFSPKVNIDEGFIEDKTTKKYGWYQGTSMATPHASGIAALICSKFGKMGFTADELKSKMMSFRNKNIDEVKGNERGRLGAGYIDAAVALEEDLGKAPHQPKDLPMTEANNPKAERFQNITVAWKPAVDEDASHGFAVQYHLYMSEKAIKAGDLSFMQHVVVSGLVSSSEDIISYKYKNLKDGQTYYFALIALDKWGHKSAPIFFERSTLLNHAPVVTNVPQEVVNVLNVETGNFLLDVKEEDGHKWKFTLSGNTRGVFVTRKGDQLHCRINAVLDPGEYAFSINLEDELHKSSVTEVKFRIIAYEKPRLVTTFENLICGLSQGVNEFNLLGAYRYTPQVPITLTARSSDGGVVTASMDEKGNLRLTPHKIGEARIDIEAKDRYNSLRSSFQVRVVANADAPVYLLYPIPVKETLNMVFNPTVSTATVVLKTLTGEQVLRKSVVPNVQTRVATLDTSKLAPGAYRLTIETSKGEYTKVINKY